MTEQAAQAAEPADDQERPPPHRPGVYFKLPWADYLASESLGSGAIKDLLISPEDYWYGHRDPQRERPETEAMARGRAYHTYILEGAETFHQEYAPKPDKADYPEAAVTMDDLKAICAEYGIKAARSKAATIEALRDFDWTGEAWDEIKADLEEQAAGKTMIAGDDCTKIESMAKIVHGHDHIAVALEEGWPEVTFFVDIDDVAVRARIDWLGPKWQVALKTFSNPNRTPIDKHIANRVAYEKYFVELVMYAEIIEAAKQLPDDAFHDAPDGFVETFKASDPHQAMFVFLGTDTPCVRARGMVRKGAARGIGGRDGTAWAWEAGSAQFHEALRTFRQFRDQFGMDKPWRAREPIRYFQDTEFPPFIME